jgi:hypothetical protein
VPGRIRVFFRTLQFYANDFAEIANAA